MAERRMFAKKITDADAFTAMPPTAQCLYFHLCMSADDDGFSNSIRASMFNAHASTDDFDTLIKKRFIIPFESGVIVIKHWNIHNYIQNDRYKETQFLEEKARLVLKENKAYTEADTECIRSVSNVYPQVSIGKDSIDKDRLDKDSIDTVAPKGVNKFVPPTIEEVAEYCKSRNNNVDPEAFVAWYESNGWKVGKNPMKKWKAAVITWEKNSKGYSRGNGGFLNELANIKQDDPTDWGLGF